MKVYELLENDCECEDQITGDNMRLAKKIVNRAKGKAKKANPGESETDVQPHLGSHVSSFINR